MLARDLTELRHLTMKVAGDPGDERSLDGHRMTEDVVECNGWLGRQHPQAELERTAELFDGL